MARTYATPAAVIVVSILFPILGIIAVSLRFYTRSHSEANLGIDDWLTVPALVRISSDLGNLIRLIALALGNHTRWTSFLGCFNELFRKAASTT